MAAPENWGFPDDSTSHEPVVSVSFNVGGELGLKSIVSEALRSAAIELRFALPTE